MRLSAQPFPADGILDKHIDWPLDRLVDALTDAPQRPVYPYVIDTVRRGPDGRFAHEGGSPNFQGGCITLCDCKHLMRASSTFRDDRGVWVAGITGSRFAPGHARRLFYLMFVNRRADSQFDMWQLLDPGVRDAKSASLDVFGDLYEPITDDLAGDERYDPRSYQPPRAGHVHEDPTSWQYDISYQAHGRHPVLLMGDPEHSWLWSTPRIQLREQKRSRNPASSATLDAFLQRLAPDPG